MAHSVLNAGFKALWKQGGWRGCVRGGGGGVLRGSEHDAVTPGQGPLRPRPPPRCGDFPHAARRSPLSLPLPQTCEDENRPPARPSANPSLGSARGTWAVREWTLVSVSGERCYRPHAHTERLRAGRVLGNRESFPSEISGMVANKGAGGLRLVPLGSVRGNKETWPGSGWQCLLGRGGRLKFGQFVSSATERVLRARRGGGRGWQSAFCPAVPEVLSPRVCGAPRIAQQGNASWASPGGGQGGRVKRKHGFDFPDKATAAAPSHLPGRGCLLLISRLSALTGPPPAASGLRVPPAALPLRARMQPRRGTSGVRGAPAPRSSPALCRSGAVWLLLGAVTSAGVGSGSVGSGLDAWI